MPLSTADFPHVGTEDHRCQCCGRELNAKRVAWLELDQRDGSYHDREDVPADRSQGWFPFGTACARKVNARARRAA